MNNKVKPPSNQVNNKSSKMSISETVLRCLDQFIRDNFSEKDISAINACGIKLVRLGATATFLLPEGKDPFKSLPEQTQKLMIAVQKQQKQRQNDGADKAHKSAKVSRGNS